jgi:hypothetical protein
MQIVERIAYIKSTVVLPVFEMHSGATESYRNFSVREATTFSTGFSASSESRVAVDFVVLELLLYALRIFFSVTIAFSLSSVICLDSKLVSS